MALKFNIAALLAASTLTLAGTAQGAAVQYGFDFTSGTVADNGGTVNDDSGNGNTGRIIQAGTGNGGMYTADIPTFGVQNATGIGSLDLAGSNSLSTSPTAGSTFSGEALNGLSATDISNAGGLTFEIWVRNAGKASPSTEVTSVGDFLVLGGMYGIVIDGTGAIGAVYGDNIALGPRVVVNTSEWTHVAVTMSTTSDLNTNHSYDNVSLYINGAFAAEDADGHTFAFGFLNRAMGVGKHGVFDADDAEGLVYEPRISLGVLDPSAFTTSLPEPGSLALLGLGGLAMLRRRLN